MTQKIILHGEPAFLKQSPLGWYRVVRPLVVTLKGKTYKEIKYDH